MVAPDLIMKSKRKTISLCIMKDGRVVLRAPTRAKQSDIDKFIMDKQSWLISKLAILENNKFMYDDVINYKKLLFLGSRHTLKRGNGNKIVIDNEFGIVIPSNVGDDKVFKHLKSWYKKQAKAILEKRTQEISEKIKLYPAGIRISDSKGRWGACNSKNVISYNWRVIMLPPYVIDYVIVHELCHMIEFNHSKKFWSLVLAFLPDAKSRREKIKEYSFILDMFLNKK